VDYFDKAEKKYYEIKLNDEKQTSKPTLLKPIKCKELKIIGNGSYGTVSRGFDMNNRITMAIKRIEITKLQNK